MWAGSKVCPLWLTLRQPTHPTLTLPSSLIRTQVSVRASFSQPFLSQKVFGVLKFYKI